MKIGDEVLVIDKHDMNFGIKGKIANIDDEPDADGIKALIVKFKIAEVPYYPNQLQNLKGLQMTDQELLQLRETYSMFCTDEKYIEIAKTAYEKGLNIGQDGVIELHIALSGTWSARVINQIGSGVLESFEKIGDHTGSNAFLIGVRDAGISIIDHREQNKSV